MSYMTYCAYLWNLLWNKAYKYRQTDWQFEKSKKDINYKAVFAQVTDLLVNKVYALGIK